METPTKKSLKWSAEAERDLWAACLVASGEPKGNTLKKAVEILEESYGVVVTVKAASHRVQHLQKLKRKEGTGAADGGSANGGSAKRKASTPRGKKRTKAASADDDDDDAEPTPSKKVAKGKKRAAPAIDDDEEEVKSVKNEGYFEDSDKNAV